jgi:hypothetical protein
MTLQLNNHLFNSVSRGKDKCFIQFTKLFYAFRKKNTKTTSKNEINAKTAAVSTGYRFEAVGQ